MKTFSTVSFVLAIVILFVTTSVAKARTNGDGKAVFTGSRSGSLDADLMDTKIGSTGECKATFHYYRPRNMGWNMRDPTVNTYCSTWDANKPLSWRSKHGWTAFCRPNLVPIGESICGKCLKVKNVKTGASTIARIVDQCTKPEGGLDLDDQTVFKVIDTDKKGIIHGHLKVTYRFVSC